MFLDSKFVSFQSPAWSEWREREREGQDVIRHCSGCGFPHRKNNHAPKREEVNQREVMGHAARDQQRA